MSPLAHGPGPDLPARLRAINRRATALHILNALVWGAIIAGFAWAGK